MRRLFFGTLAAFGVGALSFSAVAVLGALSRHYDIPWFTDNGGMPMWPVTVGFSAMSLMAVSVAILVLVAVTGVIRDVIVERRTRLEG
ncbi:hypothetical protein AB0O95_05150 [Rhodoglobus sp. NPDC076762]